MNTTKRVKLSPQEKDAIYALPLQKQFYIIHIDNGSGCAVYQHILVDTTERDYEQVLAVAKAYARETDCAINPIVNKGAPNGREIIYPGISDNANPDLTTEKYGYIDVKSPLNSNNIVRNANFACKQGAIVVITDLVLGKKLKHKQILQITEKIFSEQNRNHQGEPNYTKDEIHWYIGGVLYKYNRPKRNDSFSA